MTARDVIADFISDYYYGSVAGEIVEKDTTALLNALLSAPESVRLELTALLNPWRDMKTAPKDGTRILVAFQNHEGQTRITCVRWDDDNGWLVGRDHAKNIYFGLNRRKPTHWQHLPALPSEDK